jgi:FKBP-type peptidyl-prolyl cis-trans isomerase FklB
MKRISIICLGIMMISTVSFAAEGPDLSETDTINYSIGFQIGGDFLKQGWKLNPDMLVKGVNDAMKHADPMISPKRMKATLANLKKQLDSEQQERAKQMEGAFLAENAKKEGVVVLPSGVQYKVIKEGTGKQPTLNDSVTIQYHVARVDGQKIATGYPDAKPRTYPLRKALPGLQEVLQMMKEGSVWQVVLPPGPRTLGNQGEALEGAGTLVYDLELVSVEAGG